MSLYDDDAPEWEKVVMSFCASWVLVSTVCFLGLYVFSLIGG